MTWSGAHVVTKLQHVVVGKISYDVLSQMETVTLRKLYFQFISNLMGYNRGDIFTFDFEPNGILFLLSILNQMEFHLVQNWRENCHHDYIPINLKGIGNIVFLVQQKGLLA